MTEKYIDKIRRNAVSNLVSNGISKNEAQIEVNILIEHISGLNRKDIIQNPNQEMNQEQLNQINYLIQKRIDDRIPVQYLTNKAFFMGYEFFVNENVLIPRPETELLVEEVVNLIKKSPKQDIKLIDIGTGSGCIACMIAKLTENVAITASDVSQEALKVAETNAEKLEVINKISFINSDIFSVIEEKFDFIISNPPYIPVKEKESLQIEVSKHEPHLALFADDELGISFYKKLAEQSRSHLNSNGFLAVEIGISQSEIIKNIFSKNNFKDIRVIKDFNNIDRIIIGKF